jgi:predicted transcriptional regulator
MTGQLDSFASEALEDVAYLARSENRVRILEALSQEPHSRRDLVDVTGVSSATVGRVLQELQSHGWAERTPRGHLTTPAGDRIVAEFEPFLGAMNAIRHLGDAVEWIPTDELDIGLHHFSDVTVRRPDRYDPVDVSDFFIDLLEDAATIDALTHLVPIEAKETTMLDGVRTGRLTVDLVLTKGLLDYLRGRPGHRARWADLVESGATVYGYDDRIPCNLFVIDDFVILGKSHSDSGHPYAFILSENPTIRAWAHDLVDRYRTAAERVDGRLTAEEFAV